MTAQAIFKDCLKVAVVALVPLAAVMIEIGVIAFRIQTGKLPWRLTYVTNARLFGWPGVPIERLVKFDAVLAQ